MKPHEKERAPLAKGRRGKLTGAREYSGCRHNAILTLATPQGHVHHAALRCALCGAFLGWVAKPENVERRRLNVFRLAKLSMCEGLSRWERSFVRSVSQRRKFSPRQQQIIDRLSATHLEAKPS
jgi:hypothetical protein